MRKRPSEHVTWSELACHDEDRTPYPKEWELDRLPELMRAFERVREICGFPLLINSAYRTRTYNGRIGGAFRSQHIEGRALDLRPSTGSADLYKLREAAGKARDEGLLRGIGYYPTFVHIDTRPGKNATWRGGRSEN